METKESTLRDTLLNSWQHTSSAQQLNVSKLISEFYEYYLYKKK